VQYKLLMLLKVLDQIIKCHLAVKSKQDSHINVQNFTLKFQAVAEKTANNFRGLLLLRHLVIYLH